ncbi:MAG: sulfatase family protein [Saccharofermentanales bacterium]
MPDKPDILYLMCDQFRFDCIAALSESIIRTPGIDRLVKRGISFTNAYSTCPVCIPARYTIRTGREPFHTGCYSNERPVPMDGLADGMEQRCGPYLARTMQGRGYRTFGIGKFHTDPDWLENTGFDVMLHTEEGWSTREDRLQDAYAGFITREHPEFSHIEQLHGERTDMYYMPQTSPFPKELKVEAFAADRAIELMDTADDRPWFGFVSFVGPHPPFSPPIPYNRMYNPDCMPDPVVGDALTDLMDEQLTWMNRIIWADEINDFLARGAKARYYGMISYIDDCIGRILDKVEGMQDPGNVLICFFSDHGDHLGDHRSWQKESYFEQSAHIPFLLSWPKRIVGDIRIESLTCLTDLFAVATAASGDCEPRDGLDILGMLEGAVQPRTFLFACYGRPGTFMFKFMVRSGDYKYIFMSNGNRRQLFNLRSDPAELKNLADAEPDKVDELHGIAKLHADRRGLHQAFDGEDFRIFPYTARPLFRINQMAGDLGVKDFTVSRQRK